MLKVAQIKYIKHLRDDEGLSINEIAQRTDLDWRTVSKYADSESQVQERPRQRRKRKALLDEYLEMLETWISEDQRRKRKYRRTARALYGQLVEETSYGGSERTVRHYVKELRAKLQEQPTHISLDHNPGAAQVDFGDTLTILAGEETHERVAHKLIISFPHSNDALTRHLPAENAECFLEGLKSMFEELGGVPREIWFDNLPAAVKAVLEGDKRDLNPLFAEFSWHYRFKSVFCNPGCGNEKGNVENKVGTLRRNCDSPPQRIERWSQLDERADKERSKHREEQHYKKRRPVKELFEEDKAHLLTLPENPYTVSSVDTALVNKTGEVKIRKELYHIPGANMRQKIFARIYAYHIDFYDQYGETLLSSQSRKYVLEGQEIDWVKELECYINRPRAIEHATYLKNLPPLLREYLLPHEVNERRQRVSTLIALLKEHPLKHVEQSVKLAMEVGRIDYASLKSIALRATDEPKAPILEDYTPRAVVDIKPNLSPYSALQDVAGHE